MVDATDGGLAGTEATDRPPVSGSAPGSRAGADPEPESPPDVTTAPAVQGSGGLASRPDIVLVLMDDFSMDLLPTLESAARMRREGASYPHAYAVDSLCCVSRTSLLTGQYPHQTGVLTNISGELASVPLGGFPAYAAHGNAARSVNVALDGAGYTTGFVGKFLNEYEYHPGREVPPVLPGWDMLDVVFGSAYDGWDFWSSRLEDGALAVEHHPAPPITAPVEERDAAYAGSVIADSALDFIREHRDDRSPYFLEVAPYAPHNRTNPEGHYPGDPLFPPMFRDRPSPGQPHGDCGAVPCAELTTADLPAYDDDRGDNTPVTRAGEPARAWNTGSPRFDDADWTRFLRDRARMAQSVDRMVQRILRAVDDDTYVFLTSDNGFHLGQHGLALGKGTAYKTDVRVPLLVTGPGIAAGERVAMASNVDLAPTFEDLAGLEPAPYRAGRSLVPSLSDADHRGRDVVVHEHTGQAQARVDPDAAFTGGELDRIPSYTAVRTREALLVRHDLDPSPDVEAWGYEFYSYRDHPWERTNTFGAPRHADEVAALLGQLERWDRCTAVGDEPVRPRCH